MIQPTQANLRYGDAVPKLTETRHLNPKQFPVAVKQPGMASGPLGSYGNPSPAGNPVNNGVTPYTTSQA